MPAILKKVDAESLRSPPKFQVNIKIQLNTARVSKSNTNIDVVCFSKLLAIDEIFIKI